MQINLDAVMREAESMRQQYNQIRRICESLEHVSAFIDPSGEHYAGVRRNVQLELEQLERQGRVLSQMMDVLEETRDHVKQAEQQICERYADDGVLYAIPTIDWVWLDKLEPCPWDIRLWTIFGGGETDG